jgi:uncharacterized protein
VPRPGAQLAAIANNRLHLILLPTEQCNFRCTYCYETFQNKRMPTDVIAGVKALIERRLPALDHLRISWFGGEPLAAFDVVEDISRAAMLSAQEHGAFYTADMTTNAWHLDRRRLERCLALGITTFHIALDGGRELHDRSRRQASGAGTFDRIWSNLMAMHDSDLKFEVLLRLHYTEENWREVGAFAIHLRSRLADDPRFSIYFHSVEPFDGTSATVRPISSDVKQAVETELNRMAGLPATDPCAVGAICYAACGNSFVIRSTGRLAKCTVALSAGHNDIGTLLPDGSISVDQRKFQRWVAPVIEGRWDDMACPLHVVAEEEAADAALEAASSESISA